MNRAGWQQMALERIGDAEALLKKKRWAGAYYMAGYAVECGLKSCVLLHVENTGVIFDNPKFLEKCRTHDLNVLLSLATLEEEFGKAKQANATLDDYWKTVSAWTEESRYQWKSKQEA
jgi:HEPN domain-containing protein